LISVLGSGELFGEESFFSQSYVNCAKALDRSLVIFIAREELIRLMEAHPHLSVELATTLSHRCTTLYDRIVEASRCSVKERLASLLLQVQESNGAATPITRLSQSDIADLLGITRATVNANLRELASAGLISLAHCRVSLRDRDGLRKILQSPPLAHKTKTNASA
jgi:CRP-like cAMP-binding protein